MDDDMHPDYPEHPQQKIYSNILPNAQKAKQ
jgi:hypothetical protein